MTDQTQFLMNQAVNAIKAGDLAGGRKLLESVLEADPDNENAWMWMSAAVSTDDERRHCLEQVLKLNPENAQAKAGIEKLPPLPEAETDAFTEAMAEFAAMSGSEGQPAEGEQGGELPSAFTWALEPEQPDLAKEGTTEEVDLEALFKSFDEATEGSKPGGEAFEWTFEEPPKTEQGEAEQPLTSMDSLDRFLGVEPPGDEVRGFYEQDAREGKPVPAFTFDEETEQALGETPFAPTEGGQFSEESYDSPALPDTDFSFDGEPAAGEGAAAGLPGGTAGAGAEGVPVMWANPGGRPHNLTILRDEYLVLANPDGLFLDRIREEVARGEVRKKSLGRTAKAIPLKSVLRLTGEEGDNSFKVTYRKGKQSFVANAEFESVIERDEALELIARQLGAGFQKVEQSVTRLSLVTLPVVVIVLALLGTPLLVYLSTLLFGTSESTSAVSMALFVPAVIGIVGFMIFVSGVIWLISKLRQPLSLVSIVPAAEASDNDLDARLGGF